MLDNNNENFKKFHEEEEKEIHEVNDRISKSEEYIRKRIIKIIGNKQPHEIGLLPKDQRNKIILQLRKIEGFSIRQIERATGISREIIAKIK